MRTDGIALLKKEPTWNEFHVMGIMGNVKRAQGA